MTPVTHTDRPMSTPVTVPFTVVAGQEPAWPGITDAGRVVARFLATVRLTGDPVSAESVLHPAVAAHQVTSDDPRTITRTPAQYAAHVRDLLDWFGPITLTVTEVLDTGDRVYLRWRQDGRHRRRADGSPGTDAPMTDVGSAVYRVAEGRIAEYWMQLDRLGLARQVEALEDGAASRT